MPDVPLYDLLEATLAPAGWEPLSDGDGWRRDVDLDGDDGTPLPAALAVVPLGPGPDAPVVATVTLPAPFERPARAASLATAFSSERAPVGRVEVVGGHLRYRLAHDPTVAPHASPVVLGLVAAASGWAASLLPRALFVLVASGARLSPPPAATA